jgi:hypothetical protein
LEYIDIFEVNKWALTWAPGGVHPFALVIHSVHRAQAAPGSCAWVWVVYITNLTTWLTGTKVVFYLFIMQVFWGVSESVVWSDTKLIQSSWICYARQGLVQKSRLFITMAIARVCKLLVCIRWRSNVPFSARLAIDRYL